MTGCRRCSSCARCCRCSAAAWIMWPGPMAVTSGGCNVMSTQNAARAANSGGRQRAGPARTQDRSSLRPHHAGVSELHPDLPEPRSLDVSGRLQGATGVSSCSGMASGNVPSGVGRGRRPAGIPSFSPLSSARRSISGESRLSGSIACVAPSFSFRSRPALNCFYSCGRAGNDGVTGLPAAEGDCH